MRFLLTRPIEDSESIARQLRDHNVSVHIDPLMTFAPINMPLPQLSNYQALIFTSTNGVRAFQKLCPPADIKVLTVGNKTATMAKGLGFKEVISAEGNLEKLSGTIKDHLIPADGPLLYLCAKHRSDDLELTDFNLDQVEIYEMIAARQLSDQTKAQLLNQEINYIPFYSSRSAHIFIELVEKAGLIDSLSNITALCLSPAVGAIIKSQHWNNIITADKPDQYSLFKLIDIEL